MRIIPIYHGRVLAAQDFTGGGDPLDRNGHGTHCAGTVAGANAEIGIAPGARLVCGKGLSDGGSGGGRGIAAAMRWCVSQGATVLSMSLGSPDPDPSIDEAGRELTEGGVWIICAAGNSGGGTPNVDFPGRFPWAISIAAVDEQLRVASFSSAGQKIDTLGRRYEHLELPTRVVVNRQMSGTSMATPFAAAVLAMYRSDWSNLVDPFPRWMVCERSCGSFDGPCADWDRSPDRTGSNLAVAVGNRSRSRSAQRNLIFR